MKFTTAIAWSTAFVLIAGSWPGPCVAQDKIARIGFLTPSSNGPRKEFLDALRALGHVEGKTIAFEVRAAKNDIERLPALAAELVQAKVDLIVAVSPPAIRAAKQATSTIPIVMNFWGGEDLIATGIVASLSRPGGNITGVSMLSAELDAKRIELLVETLPKARKVAVLNRGASMPLTIARAAAKTAGVQLYVTEVPGLEGYDSVFNAMVREHVDALLVPSFPRFYYEHKTIIEVAAKRRIPAIYEWGEIARDGGLLGYGPDYQELIRRGASFVDRILKGAKPGDLPIEQPVKYEFVVNLKTAKELGITIPEAILVRADEVVK